MKLIGRVYSASSPFLERNFVDRMHLVITDRTRLCVRSKYRKVPKRVLSDRTRPITPDRTHLCVRSLSAFVFQFDCCHRPDASGHVDRRVRSVRKMLSWHITVGIDCEEYKYIPYPSI
jgi:hypothetical protein